DQPAKLEADDGAGLPGLRSIDSCSRQRSNRAGQHPDEQRSDQRLIKAVRRFLRNYQADQVDTKVDVQKPSNESSRECRRYPLDVERSFMAVFELKNVRGANKGNSHEHSNTRCATTHGCRPKKTAPANSECCSRGDSEIGRRGLGSHRPAEAYSGP